MAVILGRAFAAMWIPKMIKAKFSKNQMQRTLHGMGWKGRRAVLFADIDRIKGFPISTKALKSLPKFLSPDPWTIQPTSMQLRRKYLFHFDVTAKNIYTGERAKLTRSLYRDDLRSREELEAEMADHMLEIDPSKEWDVDKVEITDVIDRDKELY